MLKRETEIWEELLQSLENLYTYNKEEFWNLLKQIKGSSSNKSSECPSFPFLNDLYKHYKNLL